MKVDASQVLAQAGFKIVKQGEEELSKRGAEASVKRGAEARGKEQSAEELAKQSAEAAAKQGKDAVVKSGAELAKQGTGELLKSLKEGVLIGDDEEEDAPGKSAAREKGENGERGNVRDRGGSQSAEGRERSEVRDRVDIRDKVEVRERGAAPERGDVRGRGDAPERGDARGGSPAPEISEARGRGGAPAERYEVRDSSHARERGDAGETGAVRERGDAAADSAVRGKGAVAADSAVRDKAAAGDGGVARGKGDVVAESAVGGRRTVVSESDITLDKHSAVREFSDKSLAPYAAKLAELNMNVTESSARAMRDLMAQYPRLSMDEAAFLASNKITGDESLMKAALNVLQGGDKTSAMIARIISTLSESPVAAERGIAANPDPGAQDPKSIARNHASANNYHAGSSGRAPFTELIAAIVKNASGLLVSSNMPQSAVSQGGATHLQNPQPIITQLDSNMQLNTEKIIDFLQEPANSQNQEQGAGQAGGAQTLPGAAAGDGALPGRAAGGPQAAPGQAGAAVVPLPGDAAPLGGAQAGGAGYASAPGQAAQGLAAGTGDAGQAQQAAGGTAAQQAAADVAGAQAQAQESGKETAAAGDYRSLSGAVAQLLSEIPEFKGTPQAALERFSDMLLRIARDTGSPEDVNKAAEDVKSLASQLDKMFTKIGRHDAGAGARLREAREEMFARMTLVQEEISRASQPMRSELLAQTQKLMDHVRLLNNIDQFVYMQMPVKLSEEEKTAELYVFKRKGGKKADPDNVNILLSLDLQFMGHWEALLNIKGKNVYLNMEVAGEAEKDHFNANTVLLHELLAEEGFKLMNTSIKISQEETTPLTALSALDRHTGGNIPGRIDFKI